MTMSQIYCVLDNFRLTSTKFKHFDFESQPISINHITIIFSVVFFKLRFKLLGDEVQDIVFGHEKVLRILGCKLAWKKQNFAVMQLLSFTYLKICCSIPDHD